MIKNNDEKKQVDLLAKKAQRDSSKVLVISGLRERVNAFYKRELEPLKDPMNHVSMVMPSKNGMVGLTKQEYNTKFQQICTDELKDFQANIAQRFPGNLLELHQGNIRVRGLDSKTIANEIYASIENLVSLDFPREWTNKFQLVPKNPGLNQFWYVHTP